MSIVHHWLNESNPNNDNNNNTALSVQRTKRQKKNTNKHHLTSIKVDVVFFSFFFSSLWPNWKWSRWKNKKKIQSENKTMKVTTSNYISLSWSKKKRNSSICFSLNEQHCDVNRRRVRARRVAEMFIVGLFVDITVCSCCKS